jgi:hypothetical protein
MKLFVKGRCSLCREEDVILLKCTKTRKWREQFFSRKYVSIPINVDVTCNKVINSTNAVELNI